MKTISESDRQDANLAYLYTVVCNGSLIQNQSSVIRANSKCQYYLFTMTFFCDTETPANWNFIKLDAVAVFFFFIIRGGRSDCSRAIKGAPLSYPR